MPRRSFLQDIDLNSNNIISGDTTVGFVTPIAVTTLNFPAKTIGTYTIATLADITGDPDQTFSSSSDATSHTVTLSGSGGSIKFVEGTGVTLDTSGTALDGIVTINSTAGGVTSLPDLTDVTSAAITNKFVLIADGAAYVGRAMVVDDISDYPTAVEAYINDPTAEGLLEDTNNWSIDGAYTGTAITGTYQGQKHYDTAYFFEAYDDNLWLRLPRG